MVEEKDKTILEPNKSITIPTPEEIKALYPAPGKDGRPTKVSREKIKERVDFAITLKLRGVSTYNILKEINRRSETHTEKVTATDGTVSEKEILGTGWGRISLKQLRVDLAGAFKVKSNLTAYEKSEQDLAMKELHIAELESSIQNLDRMIQDAKMSNGDTYRVVNGKLKKSPAKKVLTLGQIIYAESQKLEIQKQIARLRGWDKGDTNITNNFNGTTNINNEVYYDKFTRAIEGTNTKLTTRICEAIDGIIVESENEAGPGVASGVSIGQGEAQTEEEVEISES